VCCEFGAFNFTLRTGKKERLGKGKRVRELDRMMSFGGFVSDLGDHSRWRLVSMGLSRHAC
jgi:hypothetical protein